MKIATLQFAPTLGAVEHNISRADALLSAASTEGLDLLVLPEMAFTGYNFPNLESITPFLEPTTSGPSARWAAKTAKRLGCHVIVGYPERSTWQGEEGKNFNALVVANPSGEIIADYRKSFLYYTDETWATEGFSEGFSDGFNSIHATEQPFYCAPLGNLLPPTNIQHPDSYSTIDQPNVGLGICMDINPYRFTAPWTAYEFANTMIKGNAKLIVVSMAWLTRLGPEDLEVQPERPDMETVAYWLERFYPFVFPATCPRDEEVTVVFANRCGIEGSQVTNANEGQQRKDGLGSRQVEDGVEIEEGDRVCYAGSSCVMRFIGGNVRMFEKAGHEVAIMGKGEEGVLVVDTEEPARFLLQQKAV